MIDMTALAIAAFGTGSLVFSFVQYTLSRRKIEASTTDPLKEEKNASLNKASA
jgi:hypothetical protein